MKNLLQLEKNNFYVNGISLPNFLMAQGFEKEKNIHEIYHDILKTSESHI
jgi:hypothetical protein